MFKINELLQLAEVEFLDMMMNEKCPHTGQTYRELGVDKLLALPLITEVFESLKEDGAAVVEDIASWQEAEDARA